MGGVPAQLVPDNPKVGVTRANWYEPGLNRTYLDLATHYGRDFAGLTAAPARQGQSRSRRAGGRALDPGAAAQSTLLLARAELLGPVVTDAQLTNRLPEVRMPVDSAAVAELKRRAPSGAEPFNLVCFAFLLMSTSLVSKDARCRCSAIHALASVAVANGLTVIGWLSEVMTSTENPSPTGITQ